MCTADQVVFYFVPATSVRMMPTQFNLHIKSSMKLVRPCTLYQSWVAAALSALQMLAGLVAWLHLQAICESFDKTAYFNNNNKDVSSDKAIAAPERLWQLCRRQPLLTWHVSVGKPVACSTRQLASRCYCPLEFQLRALQAIRTRAHCCTFHAISNS